MFVFIEIKKKNKNRIKSFVDRFDEALNSISCNSPIIRGTSLQSRPFIGCFHRKSLYNARPSPRHFAIEYAKVLGNIVAGRKKRRERDFAPTFITAK